MNPLREVNTEDLVNELKTRRWQGVDFVKIAEDERYRIEVAKSPAGTPLGTLSNTGPATILIITI